jgi:hypothetical protein
MWLCPASVGECLRVCVDLSGAHLLTLKAAYRMLAR